MSMDEVFSEFEKALQRKRTSDERIKRLQTPETVEDYMMLGKNLGERVKGKFEQKLPVNQGWQNLLLGAEATRRGIGNVWDAAAKEAPKLMQGATRQFMKESPVAALAQLRFIEAGKRFATQIPNAALDLAKYPFNLASELARNPNYYAENPLQGLMDIGALAGLKTGFKGSAGKIPAKRAVSEPVLAPPQLALSPPPPAQRPFTGPGPVSSMYQTATPDTLELLRRIPPAGSPLGPGLSYEEIMRLSSPAVAPAEMSLAQRSGLLRSMAGQPPPPTPSLPMLGAPTPPAPSPLDALMRQALPPQGFPSLSPSPQLALPAPLPALSPPSMASLNLSTRATTAMTPEMLSKLSLLSQALGQPDALSMLRGADLPYLQGNLPQMMGKTRVPASQGLQQAPGMEFPLRRSGMLDILYGQRPNLNLPVEMPPMALPQPPGPLNIMKPGPLNIMKPEQPIMNPFGSIQTPGSLSLSEMRTMAQQGKRTSGVNRLSEIIPDPETFMAPEEYAAHRERIASGTAIDKPEWMNEQIVNELNANPEWGVTLFKAAKKKINETVSSTLEPETIWKGLSKAEKEAKPETPFLDLLKGGVKYEARGIDGKIPLQKEFSEIVPPGYRFKATDVTVSTLDKVIQQAKIQNLISDENMAAFREGVKRDQLALKNNRQNIIATATEQRYAELIYDNPAFKRFEELKRVLAHLAEGGKIR